MRVIVYPHDLNMGGSQLNAIEIGAAMKRRGHEVVVFGRRGSLVPYVEQLDLEFIEAPDPVRRPSLRIARALRAVAEARDADIVHGYEWPPSLEAVYARRIGSRAVPVSTVMSMAIPPFIPRNVMLAVGTEQIAEWERRSGRSRVRVIEPPVDTVANAPGMGGDLRAFRKRFGIEESAVKIVVVSRLAHELKLEGILTAIDEVGRRAESENVQLLIAGDGPARQEVENGARDVNARVGRDVIVLTGHLEDPRAAYDSADIVLGMGGSALRALAFSKPLIVQGENGYWKTLTEATQDEFLWQGWYGYGAGQADSAMTLANALESLLQTSEHRSVLGGRGRALVVNRFSLDHAAARQEEIYTEALARSASRRGEAAAEAAALVKYSAYYAGKRIRRAAGRERMDDFNSKPVAASGLEKPRNV